MPEERVHGAELHYTERGAGPETIVFAHGLLWNGRMFDEPMAALADRYRCIAFDFRGHGGSEVTAGGYDMDTLAADALALVERLGCAPCHFVGLSMGGFVGMRLAIRHAEALRSLVLLNTTADPEPAANVRRYRLLSLVGRWLGLRAVASRVMPVMFGRTFLHDPARAERRRKWRRELVGNDRVGVTRAVTGVLERDGIYEQLDRIRVPTLVVCGEEDVATVPEKSERIHARVAGSRLRRIPRAGHSSTIEEPAAVTAAIEEFLGELPGER